MGSAFCVCARSELCPFVYFCRFGFFSHAPVLQADQSDLGATELKLDSFVNCKFRYSYPYL